MKGTVSKSYHNMRENIPVHIALFIHLCAGQALQILLLKLQDLGGKCRGTERRLLS